MAYNISVKPPAPGDFARHKAASEQWFEEYSPLFEKDRKRQFDIALKSRLSKGLPQAQAEAEASRVADSKVRRSISDDILKNQGKYVSQLKWASMSDREKRRHTEAMRRKSNPYSFSPDKIQYGIRRMQAEDDLRSAGDIRERREAQMRLDLLNAQEQEFRQQYNQIELSGRKQPKVQGGSNTPYANLMKESQQREQRAKSIAEWNRMQAQKPQAVQSPYMSSTQAHEQAGKQFGQSLSRKQLSNLKETNPQRYKQYTSLYKAAGGKASPYSLGY
jgi:hypothetical protein